MCVCVCVCVCVHMCEYVKRAAPPTLSPGPQLTLVGAIGVTGSVYIIDVDPAN